MNPRFRLAALLSLLLSGEAAWAAQRTFVKSSGSDANPCSLTAPCRQFFAAIAAADPGGEVVVLDSAGYGVFTVDKGLSIIAPLGVYAGITAFSGAAVTVAAGSADEVVLRGLTLKGLGGATGIAFNSGAALHVESCVLSDFSQDGIAVGFSSETYIKDTIIRGCDNTAVDASAPSGTADVSIDGSRFERNGLVSSDCAVMARNRARIAVGNSVASGNARGFCAEDLAIGTAQINVRDCMATYNGIGIGCFGGTTAAARVAGTLVTNNGTGLNQELGCIFESLGDNLVRGNLNNTVGTITVIGGN